MLRRLLVKNSINITNTIMLSQLWFATSFALLFLICRGDAYSITPNHQQKSINQKILQQQHEQSISKLEDRRNVLINLVGMSSILTMSTPALAFDGSGSTASAGLSPASKGERKRQYQERIVADVRDFNTLGKAIRNGETDGPAWVNFFIQFQRREPDTVGRTYAALVDLRGTR